MQKRWFPVVASTTLALVVFAAALSGQGRGGAAAGPQRDVSQAAIGTGTIAGVVVLEGSGTPVRRARVSLAAPELRGGRSVFTDDQGRFVFAALPAGRYTITASKAGFVNMTYGATRPGRPGTPIQLTDGQTLDRITLALPRGSVITGVVVDEHGEPAPGTQVRAMRFAMQTGERRLQMAGQDQTDDRGMYRIFQLEPGEYIVSAVPRNANIGDVRQAIAMEIASLAQAQGGGAGDLVGRGNALEARMAALQQQLASYEEQATTSYAPVYYPGGIAPGDARPIPLGPGEERTGVNFRLQLVGTTTVTGLVVAPSGMAPQGTVVSLVPRAEGMPDIPGLGNNTARVGSDGRFTFNQVAPGPYVLQARANLRAPVEPQAAAQGRGRGGRGQGPIQQVLWASADLSVSGQPMPNIVLTLREGMTVSGSVRFEGAEPPEDLSSVRVTLAPRGAQAFELGGMPPAEVDSTGQFRINGVAPGRYTIAAAIGGGGRIGGRGGRGLGQQAPTSGGWLLQSAMLNGRDLLDFPVEIGPNQNLSGIVLTWSTRTQELSGTIQDTSGRPTADFTIIVFPGDSQYWQPQSRRINATRPGTDGRFTFRNLPAGEYRLTAVTDVEPGEWFDPAFLRQLSSASIPISLSEGEQKVQDIRVAGQ